MKAWYQECRARVRLFLSDYGKVAFGGVAILFIVVTTVILILESFPKKLRVTFLDVGQGDAILIQTPGGHDMLIDGGPNSRVLEGLAKEMNYFDRHIDVVVSTHPDADHTTGLISVLEKFEVSRVVVSPLPGHTGVFDVLQKNIDDEHALVHVGKKGDEIIFGDGVVARILYPRKNFHGSDKETNDASVSMVITYGDESVLLTGDLPSSHEGELLQGVLPHHVTIYKAGHHGSKYSSGEQLLSYIRPEYAVISAGKNNKYGHPNPEALSRLQTYAKEVLSTIERGAVTFLLDGKNMQLETSK